MSVSVETIIIITYGFLAIGTLVLAIILHHFYRLYKRYPLRYWSWSWWGLSIYLLGALVSLYNLQHLPLGNIFRFSTSLLTTIAGYFQVIWLLMGTLALFRHNRFNKTKHIILLVAAVVISIVITSLYAFDPAGESFRNLLRVGVRSLVAGFAYVFTGFYIIKLPWTIRSTGRFILIAAFVLYGVQHLYYFAALTGIYQGNLWLYQFSPFVVIGELLVQSSMGLGMVLWLLEGERQALKLANEELDSIVYSTSHDLRAPLTSVLGLVNVAKLDPDQHNTNSYLEMIERSVQKMFRVLTDILNYSRNTRLDVHNEPIEVKAILLETIDDLLFMDKIKAIDIQLDELGEDRITTDRERLKIILTNLLANAIKFHNIEQAKPYIRVVSEINGSKAIIRVEDNGTGIEKADQQKIFNMFYRAHEISDGAGLGLYIAHQAALKINGRLVVQSEKDQGSTFTLELRHI